MWARIGRWTATGAILLAALFLFVLGGGNHLELVSARELVASGARSEGVVTELIGRKKSNSYDVYYRFPAEGREFSGARRPVPYRMRDEVQPGARIRVYYDRADPSRNVTEPELAELENAGNRLFFWVAGGALLAWAIARMRRRAQRR